MLNLKQLQEEANTIESLKLVTEVLGDIATTKLRNTRRFMEQNVEYFQEMYQVYRMVRQIALKGDKHHNRVLKLLRDLEKRKNGKTICLLLTSNQRFNGGLDAEITRLFLKETEKINSGGKEADFFVIGAMGEEFLNSSAFNHKWTGVKFKKDFPSLDELRTLSQTVFQYTKILVFHTKFESLLKLSPTITDITSSDVKPLPNTVPIYYIIEPEIDKMVAFFENQILILLFQAIFSEVELCRLASRMIAMNKAGESANQIISENKKQILKAQKGLLNLEILGTYAGMIKKHGTSS
jgi:ATP synthase F1 gamma subunit